MLVNPVIPVYMLQMFEFIRTFLEVRYSVYIFYCYIPNVLMFFFAYALMAFLDKRAKSPILSMCSQPPFLSLVFSKFNFIVPIKDK